MHSAVFYSWFLLYYQAESSCLHVQKCFSYRGLCPSPRFLLRSAATDLLDFYKFPWIQFTSFIPI